MRTRPIPSSGELLPVVGLGTWLGFDVSPHGKALTERTSILRNLFESGGSVIDTSPMYGRAEAVVGRALADIDGFEPPFIATKVWTEGRRSGVQQMETSLRLLNVDMIDLMQIHNLLDWSTHLKTLRDWKDSGRVRYIGITHYTNAGLDLLCRIMEREPIDFVQCCYSIQEREAENRLLPLAADKGIAVLVNKPFGQGHLFRSVRNRSVPEIAKQLDCGSWAQFFLKFIIGHPAVTCVIPGTGRLQSIIDNVKAGSGALPDEMMQLRMLESWQAG